MFVTVSLTLKLHEATLTVMTSVGLRALKNRLSAYIRQVRAGARIQVTDRGEVIAEIVPPARTSGTAAGLLELERRGLLRRPAATRRGRYPTLPPAAPPGTAQRLLDEERGPS